MEVKDLLRWRGASHFTLAILPPLLLSAGVALPLVQSSFGYTWSITGAATYILYICAAVLLIVNLLSDQMRGAIRRRVQVALVLILGVVMLFGLHESRNGINWFRVQTAYDAPRLEMCDRDAYWKTLYRFEPTFESAFPFTGSLRGAYEYWGPGLTLNGREVFYELINSLDQEKLKLLLRKAKVRYYVFPMGVLALVAALFVQIWLASRMSSERKGIARPKVRRKLEARSSRGAAVESSK